MEEQRDFLTFIRWFVLLFDSYYFRTPGLLFPGLFCYFKDLLSLVFWSYCVDTSPVSCVTTSDFDLLFWSSPRKSFFIYVDCLIDYPKCYLPFSWPLFMYLLIRLVFLSVNSVYSFCFKTYSSLYIRIWWNQVESNYKYVSVVVTTRYY